MRCQHCGFENPEIHNFCGVCGQRLLWSAPAPSPVIGRSQETVGPEAVPREIPLEPPREGEADIGGPSFLGLDSPNARGYEYLLDEDTPSYRGVWVTLIVLAVLAVVAVAYWQPIRNFVIAKASAYAQSPPPPASQTAPPPPATPENQAVTPAPLTESQPGPTSPEASASAKNGESGSGPTSDFAGTKAKGDNKSAELAAEKTKGGRVSKSAEDEETADAEETTAKSPAARGTDQLVASGERYLYGRGVPKNCNQAIGYFRAAAEQADPRALSRLGALYSVGECVPQDRVMAYVWFARAREADPGNFYLERNLNILWREMTSDERRRVMGTNR